MQLMVFGFADDYSFAVLQSSAHWQWFVAKCSKLTERFRYTGHCLRDLHVAADSHGEAGADRGRSRA